MQKLSLYGIMARNGKHMGQITFQYPDLIKQETKIYGSYIKEVFMQSIQPILRAHMLLQGSRPAYVIKIDGGFKVTCNSIICIYSYQLN